MRITPRRRVVAVAATATAAVVVASVLLASLPWGGATATGTLSADEWSAGPAPDVGTVGVGPADAPVKQEPDAPRRKPAPAAAGCALPANSVWRADVSTLPVHSRSAAYVRNVGPTRAIHPDFGSGNLEDGKPFGIPVTAVKPGTPKVRGHFTYDDESDAGPYAIPRTARIEGGPNGDGDRHIIALDSSACRVYELFNAFPRSDGGWDADSGAIFALNTNKMRTLGHTSADAAGLSIYAGLVRYDEVAAGRIKHALRMTVSRSQRAFIWPASHFASSSTDKNLPPMGLRFRLKAGVDISTLPPQARVIAEALKRYGAIVADNGSNWFFTGTQDSRWNNDQLRALKRLKGSDFEAVDASGLMVSRSSYEARTG